VGDLQLMIRSALSQKETVQAMQHPYSSKSIAPTDIAPWTVSDGAGFPRLLKTRNAHAQKLMTKLTMTSPIFGA
jgi:hypothetical protein